MDGFNQGCHMLGRGVLMDAMPQIENMGGARLGGVGVRFAKAV